MSDSTYTSAQTIYATRTARLTTANTMTETAIKQHESRSILTGCDMTSGTLAAGKLTESAEEFLNVITRLQLGAPALLFLAGHRPLAFAAGQFLHALTPLADLLDINECSELASLLSHPDGVDMLVQALESPAVVRNEAPVHDS